MNSYRPFDQERHLPPPPWQPDDPALIAWESAHGHDVRTKCYPEYGCQAIGYALDAVEEIVEQARKISLSTTMAVYVTDIEIALGIARPDTPRPHKLGADA